MLYIYSTVYNEVCHAMSTDFQINNLKSPSHYIITKYWDPAGLSDLLSAGLQLAVIDMRILVQ